MIHRVHVYGIYYTSLCGLLDASSIIAKVEQQQQPQKKWSAERMLFIDTSGGTWINQPHSTFLGVHWHI